MVGRKLPAGLVSRHRMLPETVEGRRVDVVEVGRPSRHAGTRPTELPSPLRDAWRPLVQGISVGDLGERSGPSCTVARIGAVVGGCPDDTVRAVRDFGHHCGHAFLHAEDVLALRGLRTRLDTSLPTMLDSGTSAIPDLLPARPVTAELLTADPGLHASALKASSEECERRHRLALAAAGTLEARIPRDMFRRFAGVLAAPAAAP